MTIPEAVESRIANAPVSAHLATSVDDRPHVAPVWYGYRDGVLYFLTGGRKLSNIRRNPRVSISIESASDGDVEWNVTLLGRATVRDDQERIDWASDWIYDKYDDEADEDEADEDDVDTADTAETAETTDTDDGTAEMDGPDDVSQTDGGESTEGELDYALVEVRFGTASMNTYE